MTDDLERDAYNALGESNDLIKRKPWAWLISVKGWALYMRQVRLAEMLRAYRLARVALRRAIRGLRRMVKQSAE